MKSTIIDSFLDVVAKFPQNEALIYKKGHHFESLTYEDLYIYAQKLAVYLKQQGVREGDRIVLLSENRPEWVISDIASMILGTILFPIHNVLAGVQIKMITDEVEPRVILVSNSEQLQKIESAGIAGDALIGYLENERPASNVKNLFLFKSEVYDGKFEPKIEPVKQDVDRVITIIYTSGTTGLFKGVELTNGNFITNITDVLTGVEVTENDKFLSILPLSHVFERTVGYYVALLRGATISYVEDPKKLAEIAKVQQPTIIIAVPRLYEKVYEGIVEKAESSPIKKIIFRIAVKVGKKMPKDTWAYKLADKLVFRKVKAAFGGEIRFFVSGAAALPMEIGQFFEALDMPVLEGYGLTETSPIIANNTLKHRRYGTIGQVLPSLQVKIVKDELYVRGPSVFRRYYKNPEKTKEAFTTDGWFKTGDLASIDEDGYIKFKARQKEIIVLSTGKNISPAYIEEKLEATPGVNQAFVFGDGQRHVGALVVPDKAVVGGRSAEETRDFLAKNIDTYLNQNVASYEQIRKFIVTSKPFTVEGGLMTPTLKLRRKEIEVVYAKELVDFYKEA
jgi:long-chain acyl-CoA synthetase